MSTFKLTIAYDGTNYCGWQVQINGPTVQSQIEKAMAQITGERIRVTGSGRTDAGVHALGQVAGFKSVHSLSCAQWHRALNGRLPDDIRILDVEELEGPFDPVRDTKGKRYRYVLCDGPTSSITEIPAAAANKLLASSHDTLRSVSTRIVSL